MDPKIIERMDEIVRSIQKMKVCLTETSESVRKLEQYLKQLQESNQQREAHDANAK